MGLYENELYLNDISHVADLPIPWEKLQNKSILISGATGLIGSFLVDVLMERNRKADMNCRIYVIGRSEKKAKDRFKYYWQDGLFGFIEHDINRPLERGDIGKIDFIVHLASNIGGIKNHAYHHHCRQYH